MSFKINPGYILLTAFAVALSWVLHEFSHWVMGEWLGYDMTMTLNKTFPSATNTGQLITSRDGQLISAAGPLFTLFEALLIFFLLRRRKIIVLYPFLFSCFYMRFLAAVISFFNPNDEARISEWLGWGVFTLPLLIVLLLFYLLYSISKSYKLSFKFNLLTLSLVILFSSVIILTDQYFQMTILK